MSDYTDEESRLAVALHDAECPDRRCEPQVFSDRFPVARRLLASDYLAAHDEAIRADQAERIAVAIREFADSRGVNIGDDDTDWWKGYRQAQRECLQDAQALLARTTDTKEGA